MTALNQVDSLRATRAALSAGAPQHFIDGRFVDSVEGRTLTVENPSTCEQLATVAAGTAADIDAAARAAHQAFRAQSWAGMPATERSKLLWRLADAIEKEADELAAIETLDNGMPFAIARHVAIPMATESLRYYAGWPTKLAGETLPVSAPGEWHGYTVRQPVGVVGVIAAWNFPLSMVCGKIAPALAAGCTVVVKPAEQTPLSVLRLARILHEVGFPDGVVNIVTGYGKEAGQALVEHPLIDKISFTGSTATGKSILASASRTLKRVTLELGGKSPNVIFADADLGPAIESAAMGVFFNTGQICVARSRLFVHERVYEQVVEGIKGFAAHLKVGDGFLPDSVLGPLVSQAQLDRVRGYIERGVAEGAQVAAGGSRIGARGYFFQPTVLTQVKPDMAVMREEIFGPVVCATPFGDDDLEVIAARANETQYGLAASVWTRDLSTAHRMALKIQAGSIEVNGGPPMQFAFPFGGVKASGIGRENGRAGIENFTETKSVLIRLK